MSPIPSLTVVMYHYVRDPDATAFPRLKALRTDAFREQIQILQARYEMATLESALAFVAGRFTPARDLCLLTFDDGLKEHAEEVLPILIEHGIGGLFFVPTGCIEQRVAAVHKNHFLLAAIGLECYRAAFLERLALLSPTTSVEVDPGRAQAYYRFDHPDVAAFKYLAIGLSNELRTAILDHVFEQFLGDERAFARSLYMTWEEIRTLQREGMVIGGHSHLHAVLRGLPEAAQRQDLGLCADELSARLAPQALWPFSYPYGEFDSVTVDVVRKLGFHCGFGTQVGANTVRQDLFQLRRIDTNDVASWTAACTL